MIACDLAAMLKARTSGRGKWQARCPAHADRSPSLSICEGREGRVLVHCFAGCAPTQILAALGLAIRDLFAGPPPTNEQVAALVARREARERVTRMERQMQRDAWARVRKWQAIVNLLGAKLARGPDDMGLGTTFHQACDRLHELETEAEKGGARANDNRANPGELYG
jgi:hypothetical protein